jgi:hypothetical protein
MMIGKGCRFGGGNLMWVGPRGGAELNPVFEYCLENALQVSWRRDLVDAVCRPVAAVNYLVLARPSRAPIDVTLANKLVCRHPAAQAIEVVGSLACGDRASRLAVPRIRWHEAVGVIERFLQPGQRADHSGSAAAKSVAVITAAAASADPLLDVATSCAAAAVWCRQPHPFATRNFDVIWWDDSVAFPTNQTRWRERLGRGEQHRAATGKHVWLVNMPDAAAISTARGAGVDLVLSKPTRVDDLIASLDVRPRAVAVGPDRLRNAA